MRRTIAPRVDALPRSYSMYGIHAICFASVHRGFPLDIILSMQTLC